MTAASLVKENNAIALRIKELSCCGRGSSARTAVYKDTGLTLRISALFKEIE